MRTLFSLLLLIVGMVVSRDGQCQSVKLKTGDLIFQNLDCGDMCDAIEAVTEGYNGMKFSHIGLVYISDTGCFVIEAIGENVQLTPLEKFFARTTYKMPVGRLKAKWQKLIPAAVDYALNNLNVPYDEEFLYDNGKYYCSELIYDAFKEANKGKPVFQLQAMTFKEPGKSSFFPVWVEYYKKLNIPVPEGKPGCNPGGLSASGKIDIVGDIQYYNKTLK